MFTVGGYSTGTDDGGVGDGSVQRRGERRGDEDRPHTVGGARGDWLAVSTTGGAKASPLVAEVGEWRR